jgi:hypothetical protein
LSRVGNAQPGWRVSEIAKYLSNDCGGYVQLISECAGKKIQGRRLTKAMIAKHGEDACNKDDYRQAIRFMTPAGASTVILADPISSFPQKREQHKSSRIHPHAIRGRNFCRGSKKSGDA